MPVTADNLVLVTSSITSSLPSLPLDRVTPKGHLRDTEEAGIDGAPSLQLLILKTEKTLL